MAFHKFDYNNRITEGHAATYQCLSSSLPATDSNLSLTFTSAMYTDICGLNDIGAMSWCWRSSTNNNPSQLFRLNIRSVIPFNKRVGKLKITWRGKAREYCKYQGGGLIPCVVRLGNTVSGLNSESKDEGYTDPVFEIGDGRDHNCPVICKCIKCLCVVCPSEPPKVRLYAFNYTTGNFVYLDYVRTSWMTKTIYLASEDYIKANGDIVILAKATSGGMHQICMYGYALAIECYTDYIKAELNYRKPNTTGTDEKHWEEK